MDARPRRGCLGEGGTRDGTLPSKSLKKWPSRDLAVNVHTEVPFSMNRPSLAPRGLRPLRAATVAFASALLLAVSAVPSNATYSSGGVGTHIFNVQITGVNSTWYNHIKSGVNSWNNVAAPRPKITVVDPTPSRTATAASYSATWYGLYTPGGTRTNRTFKIQLNTRTLARDAGTNLSSWARGTSTHEFGHALSQADNPSTSSLSIMKYNRDRTRMSPYLYDIEGVRDAYNL